MRCFVKLLICLTLVAGLTCSCGSSDVPKKITPMPIENEEVALKKSDTMVNGDVYIYADDQLFDLLKMKWIYPTETPLFDKAIWSPDEWISKIKKGSKSYILTITVEGYTEQVNTGKADSTNMFDYTLVTNCRIDKIHYLGEEVLLQEGQIYEFEHIGYWVLNQDDCYVYSRAQGQSMLRYGRTYIIFGSVGTQGNLSILSDTGCTEICDTDDFEQFQAKIWEIEGKLYPKQCKEFLEYFTQP